MNNYMIKPSIVDLLTKVDNRYSLVIVTSKRARQLIDGYDAQIKLEEASKPLTVAINEFHEGKVIYESVAKGIK